MPRRLLAVAALGAAVVGACTPSASAPSPSPSATLSADPSGAASTGPGPSPSDVVTAWRQLAPAGSAPVPREDHTWTVDADGGVAYLFGGRGESGTLDDFWAFDLEDETWDELAAGPAGRFGHNAAWVPEVGVVIFAGQGDGGFFNDLWAFDPDVRAWRELPASGAIPVRRYGSCAALGPDGRLWISHGFTGEGAGRFSDTKAYDFATGMWTDETPVGAAPIVRCLHGCWWTDAGQLALYAGQTTGTTSLDDWWELTVGERPGTNAWAQVSAELPPARNLYAATRWGPSTVVFGGQALDGSRLGDVWRLADDGTASAISPVAGAEPAARSGSELVADAARQRVLLFGGIAGGTVFGDVWELTLP